MDGGRKERKLKGDKQGISYAKTPERIGKLSKGDRTDKIIKILNLLTKIKSFAIVLLSFT